MPVNHSDVDKNQKPKTKNLSVPRANISVMLKQTSTPDDKKVGGLKHKGKLGSDSMDYHSSVI